MSLDIDSVMCFEIAEAIGGAKIGQTWTEIILPILAKHGYVKKIELPNNRATSFIENGSMTDMALAAAILKFAGIGSE